MEDKTQEHILTEKEYKDYHENMVEIQRGQPRHIFLGHGLATEKFEKREFATTSDLAYGDKQTTESIIHPKTYQSDEGKTRSVVSCNAKAEEAPALFKYGQALKPKDYSQFTKKFDNNSLNLKLRQ